MLLLRVFKALSNVGVIQASENVVFKAFNRTKSVAKYFIPKITNLKDFWECFKILLSTPSNEEKSLEDSLNNLVDIVKYDPKKRPLFRIIFCYG